MTEIFIASQNPVKINSANIAFSKYYRPLEVTGVPIRAQLSDQPIGIETFSSAELRAEEVFNNYVKNRTAAFAAGIEGGIIELFGTWLSFGCICLIDQAGNKSFGTSAMFPLPQRWVAMLHDGKELGELIDMETGAQNTKQSGGAISFLTLGEIDRTNLYVQGIVSALVPFHRKPLYFG
jgi:inosine/xanthosine triphosphatase